MESDAPRILVAYDFSEREWISTWTVEGPERDYRMTSRYWRAI